MRERSAPDSAATNTSLTVTRYACAMRLTRHRSTGSLHATLMADVALALEHVRVLAARKQQLRERAQVGDRARGGAPRMADGRQPAVHDSRER